MKLPFSDGRGGIVWRNYRFLSYRAPSFRNPPPTARQIADRERRYKQWLETRNPELIP